MTMAEALRELQPILLVEDSPEDCEAAIRSLRRSGLTNPIWHCSDGDDALDLLHRRGRYLDPRWSLRPAMILLDLNLPGTDGLEVLRQIKGDPAMKKIPVVVVTTSNDERDIESSYDAGANSYIQKPVSYEGLVSSVQRLKEFWFDIVMLPKSDQTSTYKAGS
jgi:CheY-like chemotaxis protein